MWNGNSLWLILKDPNYIVGGDVKGDFVNIVPVYFA